MICVIYFMFFCEKFGRYTTGNGYRYNIVPFQEIKRFYNVLSGGFSFSAVLNLVGNVVAFIPFGLILPMSRKTQIGFASVFILTAAFSMIIETLQLYYQLGVFDVDDILLNTAGGILGYIIYCIGRIWYRK